MRYYKLILRAHLSKTNINTIITNDKNLLEPTHHFGFLSDVLITTVPTLAASELQGQEQDFTFPPTEKWNMCHHSLGRSDIVLKMHIFADALQKHIPSIAECILLAYRRVQAVSSVHLGNHDLNSVMPMS